MKNVKNIIFVITLFSILSACADWLKEENFTKIGSDYIYGSEEGLSYGLNALYNLQRDYERVTDEIYSNGNIWLYCATDLANIRTWNDSYVYGPDMTAELFPSETWTVGYQLIDRASALIKSAQLIDFKEPQNKNILISEAKVIRAMTYFKMWRCYDNILLDTIPTTSENAFEKMVYKPASKQEILDFINSDLDFAIENLAYSVDPGKISKGLARHLRAQVASWQEDWNTMAQQCDEIINNGGYSLQSIENVFGQDVNHNEAIYTFQYDEELGGDSHLAGGGSHVLGALFTARYYEIPGNYMLPDNNWGGYTYAWTLPSDYLKSLYNVDPLTGISSDKRYTNYFYPDTVVCNNPENVYYGKPIPKNAYPDNFRQYHWSLMKYRDFSKPDTRSSSYKDVIACRLAETYLLGAEAHWRLTNNSADNTALGYINKIRERAGVQDLNFVDQNVILDESARELCFEGGRWFLLKRLGVLVTQVNKYHTYGNAKTNQRISSMQDFQIRWPIPQSQIDLMAPDFPQNEGY